MKHHLIDDAYWHTFSCTHIDTLLGTAPSAGAALYASSYYYICVLILLYMCPHTTIYVSSYYYISVLILLYVSAHYYIYVCVSSY